MQTLRVNEVGLPCGDLRGEDRGDISEGLFLSQGKTQMNETLGLTMTMEQVMVTAAMPPWEMVSLL